MDLSPDLTSLKQFGTIVYRTQGRNIQRRAVDELFLKTTYRNDRKEEHKCAKYFSIIRLVQTVLNWEIGAAIFNKFSAVKVLS